MKKSSRKQGTISERMKKMCTDQYYHMRAEWQMYTFLGFLFGINFVLFIARASQFGGTLMLDTSKRNVFTMLARGSGMYIE